MVVGRLPRALVLASAVAALTFPSPSIGQDTRQSQVWSRDADWRVDYTFYTEQFQSCLAVSIRDDGDSLILGVTTQAGELFISFGDEKTRTLKANADYEVELTFDGSLALTVTADAEAFDNGQVLLRGVYAPSAELRRLIAVSTSMVARVGGQEVADISLRRTAKALDELDQCIGSRGTASKSGSEPTTGASELDGDESAKLLPVLGYFLKICINDASEFDSELLFSSGSKLDDSEARLHFPSEGDDIVSVIRTGSYVHDEPIFIGIVTDLDGGANCFVRFRSTKDEIMTAFLTVFGYFYPDDNSASKMEFDDLGPYFFASHPYSRLIQAQFDGNYATLYSFLGK